MPVKRFNHDQDPPDPQPAPQRNQPQQSNNTIDARLAKMTIDMVTRAYYGHQPSSSMDHNYEYDRVYALFEPYVEQIYELYYSDKDFAKSLSDTQTIWLLEQFQYLPDNTKVSTATRVITLIEAYRNAFMGSSKWQIMNQLLPLDDTDENTPSVIVQLVEALRSDSSSKNELESRLDELSNLLVDCMGSMTSGKPLAWFGKLCRQYKWNNAIANIYKRGSIIGGDAEVFIRQNLNLL